MLLRVVCGGNTAVVGWGVVDEVRRCVAGRVGRQGVCVLFQEQRASIFSILPQPVSCRKNAHQSIQYWSFSGSCLCVVGFWLQWIALDFSVVVPVPCCLRALLYCYGCWCFRCGCGCLCRFGFRYRCCCCCRCCGGGDLIIFRRIGAHGILADDMGLGKTLQALMAVAMCHSHTPGELMSMDQRHFFLCLCMSLHMPVIIP